MNKFIFNLQRFATTHEVQSFDDLKSKISSASAGDVIKLTKSIPQEGTSSENLTVTKDITLDLNGLSLTLNGYIQVGNDSTAGKLTIQDTGSSQGSGLTGSSANGVVVVEKGTFELASGTIDYCHSSSVDNNAAAIVNKCNDGDNDHYVKISGGKVMVTSGDNAIPAISSNSNGKLEISGDEIIGWSNNAHGNAIDPATPGTVRIKGGILSHRC